MLGIPTGADPSHHLPHYHIPPRAGAKRRTDDDLPDLSPSRRQRQDSPKVNAIIVDDHEIEDGEDSESEEDGEIVEVFPNGTGGVQRVDRDASVSEDEYEDEYTNIIEPEDEESRYNLGLKDPSTMSAAEGSSSESDSVIAIEPNGPKSGGRAAEQTQARREFWAAKGRREAADGFDDGKDYIGLD